VELFTQRLIAGVTLIGGAAACFGIGYSLGKDTNEGTVGFIREKYQALEKSEARLQAENTTLKLEIQSSRSTPSIGNVALAGSASGAASAAGTGTSSAKPSTSVEKIRLQRGQSGEAFGGKLNISLVAVPFGGEPLRYTVVAHIGAPGKDNKTMDKADVGYAITYDGFEVRVVAADTLTAVFQVTQLKPKEP
jgi:hypothetical protein